MHVKTVHKGQKGRIVIRIRRHLFAIGSVLDFGPHSPSEHTLLGPEGHLSEPFLYGIWDNQSSWAVVGNSIKNAIQAYPDQPNEQKEEEKQITAER